MIHPILPFAGDSSGGNFASAIVQMAINNRLPAFKFQFLIFPVMDLSYLNTKSYQLFRQGYGLTKKDMKWYIKLYLNHSHEHIILMLHLY